VLQSPRTLTGTAWKDPITRRLRIVAAAVITVSGIALVSSLWLLPLDAQVLLGAALGWAYLILGLGLWGRSTLSLWLGMALPAAALTTTLWPWQEQPTVLQLWRAAADCVAILCCLLALWRSAGPRRPTAR